MLQYRDKNRALREYKRLRRYREFIVMSFIENHGQFTSRLDGENRNVPHIIKN